MIDDGVALGHPGAGARAHIDEVRSWDATRGCFWW
jgi:hypothetical protein